MGRIVLLPCQGEAGRGLQFAIQSKKMLNLVPFGIDPYHSADNCISDTNHVLSMLLGNRGSKLYRLPDDVY
jgi:hypothetical protein